MERPVHFILDCSVAMSWCFEDEVSEYSNNVFQKFIDSAALVPILWPLEVANTLLMGERKRRLDSAKSIAFRETISKLPIIVDYEAPKIALTSIMELAKDSHLTAYDAAYLELAIRTGIPLATLDKALEKAAYKMKISILKV